MEEKHFICTGCCQSFLQATLLKVHIKVHDIHAVLKNFFSCLVAVIIAVV
jgi:hypothetical protein